MSEWKEYKLGDIALINMGQSPNSTTYSNIKIGLPFFQGNRTFGRLYPSIDTYCTSPIKTAELNDILFSVRAPVGDINYSPEKVCIGRGLCSIRMKSGNQVFLFYLLHYLKNEIINKESGTVFGSVNKAILENLIVKIPELPTQKAIAEILSSLDDKIELNNKINQELEDLAQTLFKRWFIDFEFPNENGDPYKSSGGEMVDSELGEIPKGWGVKRLNEVSYCFDNKRIPLSSMERARKKGEFPYYGAASLMDFVDDYLFDGEFVLMGEDGSVMDSKCHPILQYVFGKFWVNNHAHVLKGNKISTEIILCLLRNSNISDLVTGAVQPKLNQGNMNKISIPLPQDLSIIRPVEFVISCHYDLFRQNFSETKELTTLRDTLLPKLISGELELSQIQNIP
jgi:type I restriction enzyme S subunit